MLIVERDRETAQAVDADAAFFANLENQVTTALLDFDFFILTAPASLSVPRSLVLPCFLRLQKKLRAGHPPIWANVPAGGPSL